MLQDYLTALLAMYTTLAFVKASEELVLFDTIKALHEHLPKMGRRPCEIALFHKSKGEFVVSRTS